MPLSDRNNEWNKMVLVEAEKERVFIRDGVKEGFTISQAQFLYKQLRWIALDLKKHPHSA